jgi:vacuolar protein sorting-associated protein 13A/C
VLSGFSGVVVRPYKECKKDGIRGLPFGVYSGASGLFLKPLSGGLDLFAKTSEGIKNTAKIFESKVFKDRQRLPRVFYGNQ